MMSERTEPLAWALYGKVTGFLRFIETDAEAVEESAPFYEVVPLVPARSVDVDTLADVIEGSLIQHRVDEEAFALEGYEDDLPPINRRHFVARAVAEWFEKQ